MYIENNGIRIKIKFLYLIKLSWDKNTLGVEARLHRVAEVVAAER